MGKWPVAFWRDGGGMEPRRSYGPRNGLGARLSTAPPRLQPPVLEEQTASGPGPGRLELPAPSLPLPPLAPPSGPLLDSPPRGRGRSWLIVAVVVLAEVALITSAYVFANLAFPH